MKKIYTAALCALALAASTSTHASLVNVALLGQATASATAGPPWTAGPSSSEPASPDKAIDGDVTTQWNSGLPPIGWIQIDLGGNYALDSIRALTEQTPDSFTVHNVYLDGALAFTWSGNTVDQQWLEHSFASPVTARYIKIETTDSQGWVAWNEIEAYAEVPIPAAAWLFGSGLLGLLGFARRKI